MPEGLQPKREIKITEKEPITHLYECARGKEANKGLILFCTISGVIYLIDHYKKSLIQKFDLAMHGLKNDLIYFMGPYYQFDYEKNPLIIVHD